MANRVLILDIGQRGDGEETYSLIVFYVINPVITVGTSPPILVVPTPSDTLPAECTTYNLVPQAYKDQLDGGVAMFELVTARRRSGRTEQQLLQAIENKYPSRAVHIVAQERRKYARMGAWVVDA